MRCDVTVDLVRRTVDEGTAQCILGNHEFNREDGMGVSTITEADLH